MDQLFEFSRLLQRWKLVFWLDSGTLLGIVRDSKLIASDRDLDFAVLLDQNTDATKISREAGAIGYSSQVIYYRDRLQSIKFFPSHSRITRGERVIDVKFYQQHGEFAYSADFIFQPSGWGRGERSPSAFSRAIKKRIWFLVNRLIPQISVETPLMQYWLPIKCMYCWRIPVSSSPTTFLYDGRLPIPANVDQYLEAKYGDWRTPNANWNYLKDDPTLLKVPLEVALEIDRNRALIN